MPGLIFLRNDEKNEPKLLFARAEYLGMAMQFYEMKIAFAISGAQNRPLCFAVTDANVDENT